MSSLIGHNKIIDFFASASEHEALSHAYLLVGPAHVGKQTLVRFVAAQLLSTSLEKLALHPDMVLVEREVNPKTDKTRKDIIIDQIRDMQHVLSARSSLGGYKVALIADAHLMNQGAANALLKTLEEPKAKTILFLTTIDEEQVPTTIRSRCQSLYVAPVETKDIEQALIDRDVDPDVAARLARSAAGRPGLALTWAEDPDAYEQFQERTKTFLSLFGQPLYAKLQAIDHVFADKTDHIAARANLIDTFSDWELMLRDLSLHQRGLGDYRCQEIEASVDITAHADDLFIRIERAKQLLTKNVHPKLAVEHVLLAMP